MLGRRSRYRRYRKQLDRLTLNAAASNTIVGELAHFWKGVRVSDLTGEPFQRLAGTTLTVRYETLTVLVSRFIQHNGWIHSGNDKQIIAANGQSDATKDVDFDRYMADTEGYVIDEAAYLRRLQGELQVHYSLLDNQSNCYYQRVSEHYYRDIIELTRSIINALPTD